MGVLQTPFFISLIHHGKPTGAMHYFVNLKNCVL
jgi:hypothetical protein